MAGRKEGKGGHGQFLHLSPSSPLTAPYSVPLARSRVPAPQPCPSRPRALARAGIRPECLALQLAFITPRLYFCPTAAAASDRDRPSLLAGGRPTGRNAFIVLLRPRPLRLRPLRLRQLGKLTSEHGKRDMRMRCTKQSRVIEREGGRQAVYYSALESLSFSLSLSLSTIDLSLHRSSQSLSFLLGKSRGKIEVEPVANDYIRMRDVTILPDNFQMANVFFPR